jgi:hypothetical protein
VNAVKTNSPPHPRRILVAIPIPINDSPQ